MFIKWGDERINASLVKSYKPSTKDTLTGKYYQIELIFLNDEKEYLHFFKKEDERDQYLKYLDENLLTSDS